MKKIILLIGAVALFGLATGCEEEHHWHRGGDADDYYHGYGYGERGYTQPYQNYPNYNYNYPYHH